MKRLIALLVVASTMALSGCAKQVSESEALAREGCESMAKAYSMMRESGFMDDPDFKAMNEAHYTKFQAAVTAGADPRFGKTLRDKTEACADLYDITVGG